MIYLAVDHHQHPNHAKQAMHLNSGSIINISGVKAEKHPNRSKSDMKKGHNINYRQKQTGGKKLLPKSTLDHSTLVEEVVQAVSKGIAEKFGVAGGRNTPFRV